KIGNITPVVDCPLVGPTNQIVVPRSQPCTTRLAFGAQRIVTNGSNAPGVRVAAVAALHGDEIQRYLLTDSLATTSCEKPMAEPPMPMAIMLPPSTVTRVPRPLLPPVWPKTGTKLRLLLPRVGG